MDKYYPPIYKEEAFNCPYCGVYTHQVWSTLESDAIINTRDDSKNYPIGYMASIGCMASNNFTDVEIAICILCNEYSIWYKEKMIYPDRGNAPMPNPDLPDDIKADYEEAASIANRSPRGAAALLRLVIQKLCIYLGEKGKDLFEDIGNLVKKGLPDEIQKALDSVRVIGNYAVHPGTMDLKDDIQTVKSLFKLINIIAEYMITKPKQVNSLFDKLSNSQKDAITKRDNKN